MFLSSVGHESGKSGKSRKAVKKAVKQVGNSRKHCDVTLIAYA